MRPSSKQPKRDRRLNHALPLSTSQQPPSAAMASTILRLSLFALLVFPALTNAQTCDGETIAQVIFSDLTEQNSALTNTITRAGSLVIDATGTKLTTTAEASFGGFYFNAPTAFQGPGGFSLKFGLKSTDTSAGNGDAWEVFVANASHLELLPPPYGPGSVSEGRSGWSRSSAFVVEFDAQNSGINEQDESSSHVAVYLSGTPRCSVDLGVNLADGSNYTVWLDYNGFSTQAEIRISDANSFVRPATTTLNCDVDIWSTLDLSQNNHIGFFAYNPTAGNGGGAEHSIVETLSITDAYRPFDSTDCATYDNCVLKTVDSLCISPPVGGQCRLSACDPVYEWDVSGSACCAFVERASWTISASAGPGPFAAGDDVDCQLVRKTIVYLATPDRCA